MKKTFLVSDELIQLAGNLVEKHGLRGFDAIHLATSIILSKKVSSLTPKPLDYPLCETFIGKIGDAGTDYFLW